MCYVAVGDWPGLEAMRADVADFLRPFPHVDLPYTQSAYQLVDALRAGGPPSAERRNWRPRYAG